MFEDLQKKEDINLDNDLEKEIKTEKSEKRIFFQKLKQKETKSNLDYKDKLNDFKKSVNNSANIENKLFQNKTVKIKFSLIKVLVISLFLIILIGGGWFYYAQGESMLLSNQMKWNWGNKTENFYTESDLFLKLSNIDLEKQDLSFFLFPKNLELNSNLSFKVIEESVEGFSSLELDMGSKLYLNLDFKNINKNLYLKPEIKGLNEIIPFFNLSDINQEEWILIEDSTFKNIPFFPLEEKKSEDWIKEFQSKMPIFLDSLKTENIFSIKDPHQIKELDDVKLKKINYFLKEEKIDNFVFLSIDAFSKNSDDSYEIKEEFIQFKREKPEEWNNLKRFMQNLKISLWINKDTKLIEGFNFNINDFTLKTNDLELKIDLEYSNFVFDIEEVEMISPPPHSISVEEFWESVQGFSDFNMDPLIELEEEEILEDLYLKTENNLVDTDEDGIPDYIEEIIGTDPLNPDTDEDAFLDGEEVENGYNPLGSGKLKPELIDFYKQIIE